MSIDKMTTDWRLEVAVNIRALRQKRKYTQDELSKRSGIVQSTISKIEKTGSPLSFYNLYRIAHGLGVPITKVLPATSADAVADLQ